MNEHTGNGDSLTMRDLESVSEAYSRVKRCSRRLKEARDAMGLHGVTYDQIGSKTHNHKSHIEHGIVKIIQRERELKTAELELNLVQLRLWVKLYSVDDARIRLILKCRYVDLMEWEQISKELYPDNIDLSNRRHRVIDELSVDAIKKTYQRFIQQLN